MVGQSEYVVNAGLGWSSGGWDATVLYNVAGKRIAEAGSGGLPDAYEQARNLLDASLQVPVLQPCRCARWQEPAGLALPAHPG